MKAKNTATITAIIVSVLLLAPLAAAIPTPHGISGTVYELDGITHVPKVDFSVENLNTGQLVQGKTGRGLKTGAYMVSLNGNDGDTVLIRAWNPYHQSNRTVSLQGMMYDVNLLLNMTFPNTAPVVTSAPVTEAFEDSLYEYELEVYDAENDTLEYALLEAPAGMQISGDLISWMPENSDVGSHAVTVAVSDGLLEANQSYTLEVHNVNDAPEIISIPVTTATEGLQYNYDVDAVDEDLDELAYSLALSPSGMEINQNSGLISWLPDNSDVGIHNVAVHVTDGNLSANQTFVINVSNVNDLPVITSIPVTTATEGVPYSYDVEAYDIDNDTLTYSLAESPANMSIDSSTGLISWLPLGGDVGLHNVTAEVSDNDGRAVQPFAIIVTGVNEAPVITSDPVLDAFVFRLYTYDVDAEDPDGDAITYRLLTAPSRMSIDRNTGLIRWIPSIFDFGQNPVVVEVSDGQLKARQSFKITVRFFGWGGGFVQSVQKPESVSSISRRTYQYVQVQANETEIEFSVEKSWLEANKVLVDNIALYRYDEGSWEKVLSELGEESGDTVNYKARISSPSLFAISVDEEKSLEEINSQLHYRTIDVPESYIISGFIVSDKMKQVPEGTAFSFENIHNSEIVEGKTGIGPATGAFFAIVPGRRGDELVVKADGAEGRLFIEGDTEGLYVVVEGSRISFVNTNFTGTLDNGITGYTLVRGVSEKIFAVLAVVILLVSISVFVLKALRRKGRR